MKWGVLLPDEERPADVVHPRAHWREVGGLAQGVGDRHHRSQRAPGLADRGTRLHNFIVIDHE